MGQEQQILFEEIQASLTEAWQAERALGSASEGMGWEQHEEPPPAYEDAELTLGYHLDAAYRGISALAVLVGLPHIRDELQTLKDKEKNSWASVVPDQYGPGDYFSPTRVEIEKIYRPLHSMMSSVITTGSQVLMTILKNTARIVEDSRAVPKSEKDVRDQAGKIIRYAFFDVEVDPRITHPLLAFKPDFGITSLMTLVEYKVAFTKEKVNAILRGLIEDMQGYTKSDKWRTCISIIYMSGNYINQDEVNAMMKSVDAPKHWQIIPLVSGLVSVEESEN
jgi:hypothetical protein